jgi:uncharacterized protein YoxC
MKTFGFSILDFGFQNLSSIASAAPRSAFLFRKFLSGTAPAILLAAALIFAALTSSASGALVISNSTPTNITSTNAWLNANLVSTNLTNTVLTVFYGTGNGGSNTSYWSHYLVYGSNCPTGQVSILATNLTPATWYYFRWRAGDSSNTNWAAASSNFTTLSTLPTNFPAATGGVYLVISTNGQILGTNMQANFISANALATGTPLYVESDPLYTNWATTNTLQAQITANLTNTTAAIQGLTNSITNLNAAVLGLTNSVTNLVAADAGLTNSITNLNAAVLGLTNSVTNLVAADSGLTNSITNLNAAVLGLTNSVTNLVAADAASSNALTTHTTNTGNPHGVTAAQAGATPTNCINVHGTNFFITNNAFAGYILKFNPATTSD